MLLAGVALAAYVVISGIHRDAMFLPLYQLVLLFVFFVGLTVYLSVPGLKDGDLSLLRVVRDALPPPVAGAGMVVGVVVVAVLTLGGLAVGDVLSFLPGSLHHLDVGVIALVANVVVCAAVPAATRQRPGAPVPAEPPAPRHATAARPAA